MEGEACKSSVDPKEMGRGDEDALEGTAFQEALLLTQADKALHGIGLGDGMWLVERLHPHPYVLSSSSGGVGLP